MTKQGRYIEDYRRAEGIALDKASISKTLATDFGKAKIKLNVEQMGTEPEQDPDNYSNLRERVLRDFSKTGY